MPPHLVRRGKKGLYSIRDGQTRHALHTDRLGYARILLEQYQQGKLRINVHKTIRDLYNEWIQRVEEESPRPSLLRDYKQSLGKHILPSIGDLDLSKLDYAALLSLKAELSAKGLKVKTVKNIINAHLRAFWRYARQAGYVEANPFDLLQWPRIEREAPDPFTPVEMGLIIRWWEKNDEYYFPYVAWQFTTGMRPSETAALRPNQIVGRRVQILKSLVMRHEDLTKTRASRRTIELSDTAYHLAQHLLSRAVEGQQYLFVGKHGGPMTKKWAEHNWAESLRQAKVRHRKFYATRHTFITQRLEAGASPFALAQYCGTSVQMLQEDYAGVVALPMAVFRPSDDIPQQNMVAGPGFERSLSAIAADIIGAQCQLPSERDE